MTYGLAKIIHGNMIMKFKLHQKGSQTLHENTVLGKREL